MMSNRAVTVFGAYGHTGRFVVAELCRRGWAPILSGRDTDKLEALGAEHPMLELRVASIEDPASLNRATDGAVAVINCAGPFLDTATPVVEAALRAHIHYLDITAEQRAVLDAFAHHGDAARSAGIAVLPGMAFYGGLADLLATAAMDGWLEADGIDIGIALDSWHPTAGTRLTGQRNHYQRLVVTNGRLAVLANPPPDTGLGLPGAVRNAAHGCAAVFGNDHDLTPYTRSGVAFLPQPRAARGRARSRHAATSGQRREGAVVPAVCDGSRRPQRRTGSSCHRARAGYLCDHRAVGGGGRGAYCRWAAQDARRHHRRGDF